MRPELKKSQVRPISVLADRILEKPRQVTAIDKIELTGAFNQIRAAMEEGRVNTDLGMAVIHGLLEGLETRDFADVMLNVVPGSAGSRIIGAFRQLREEGKV